jgi:hypothetical protein
MINSFRTHIGTRKEFRSLLAHLSIFALPALLQVEVNAEVRPTPSESLHNRLAHDPQRPAPQRDKLLHPPHNLHILLDLQPNPHPSNQRPKLEEPHIVHPAQVLDVQSIRVGFAAAYGEVGG